MTIDEFIRSIDNSGVKYKIYDVDVQRCIYTGFKPNYDLRRLHFFNFRIQITCEKCHHIMITFFVGRSIQ